jgi:hypothetical protein
MTAINADSIIGITLTAAEIPNGATVTKPTGTARYTIRHNLKLYQDQKAKGDTLADRRPGEADKGALRPVEIAGDFLVNPRGDINQIDPDARLVWLATAGEILDWLRDAVEGDDEIPQ